MFLKRRPLPAGRPTGSVGLTAWSFDLDARVPHHFAPLVDVGLDLDGKLLRCAAHRRKAERREPLLDVRQPDDPRQYIGRYCEAYAMLQQDPARAALLFDALAAEAPNDPSVLFHVERVHKGMGGAPLVMTEK